MPGKRPQEARTPAARDYEAKTAHEAAQVSHRALFSGNPLPFGDPLSGVVLVAELPASVPLVEALRRSLAALRLDDTSYVTWSAPDLLETLLSLEPDALVAVGPGAARAIDALGRPLVKNPFSGAPEGVWFSWTKGTSGLRLPALAPALVDDAAKRRFWRAFLALRVLASEEEKSRTS